MSQVTILFADDDRGVRELVRVTLERAEMKVIPAANGAQLIELWRAATGDLVLLDVNMPRMSGLEVCRYIRRISDIPIMMLTAMDREEDVVAGFEAGADDYITKPFRPNELIARIHAILQRASRPSRPWGSRLTAGELMLDIAGRQVTLRDQPVAVTQLELQLLQYIMQRPGVAVSKEDLFQNVWGYAMPVGGMNLIEAAIRRLREKIEDDPSQPQRIHTVRGAGYRFDG
ncbi:MAG: response regulator transcription factor [Chloroflexi bacterium]|nr:response regulator transcription factor [Chloroflexota bacterium]